VPSLRNYYQNKPQRCSEGFSFDLSLRKLQFRVTVEYQPMFPLQTMRAGSRLLDTRSGDAAIMGQLIGRVNMLRPSHG
jgi:hypothetical protein